MSSQLITLGIIGAAFGIAAIIGAAKRKREAEIAIPKVGDEEGFKRFLAAIDKREARLEDEFERATRPSGVGSAIMFGLARAAATYVAFFVLLPLFIVGALIFAAAMSHG